MPSVDKPVPFLNLTDEFARLEKEWLQDISETGKRGSFILGPNVQAFESEFAEAVGVKHAISVANGTDALILSLRALGIGPGDEVITSPFTFFASAEAINIVGATPVFADIEKDSFCLDPDSVEKFISERTRAIIPVHIFGHAARMDRFQQIAEKHNLKIVEDCAQAYGARFNGKMVGSIGDTGCFSFYPTKVLGGYGDGGMITTNSSEVDEHLRRLRNHGAVKPFIHTEIGYNSRLDEIQAALLRRKLRTIDQAIESRRKVAAAYNERLGDSGIVLPPVVEAEQHAYNLFTIRIADRDGVRQSLTDRQIATALCYPQGLHQQEVYTSLNYKPGSLPVTEHACTEVMSLPIYPGMPESDIDTVCKALIS
jgi:dTDP-4-amino-4,6-dideoxygalactose transaminase